MTMIWQSSQLLIFTEYLYQKLLVADDDLITLLLTKDVAEAQVKTGH